MWCKAVYGAYFLRGGFRVALPNKQSRWFEPWSKWSGSQYKVFTADFLEKGKKKLRNSFPCFSPARTNAVHQIAYIFWRMFGNIYSLQVALHAKINWDWICLLVATAMAPHSSVLAWRSPGTGEPGRLPSMGLHRVGHEWSNLAAACLLEYGKFDKICSSEWMQRSNFLSVRKTCSLGASPLPRFCIYS